jgi:thymidylate synthase (FAD)
MKVEDFNDSYFKVRVANKSPYPQITAYLAALNDYSDDDAFDRIFGHKDYLFKDPFHDRELTEAIAGERIVNNCLKYGHWGVIEHNSLVFMVSGFPHEVMQQLRTHRHASFDVVSGRYTGQRIIDVALGKRSVEEVYYVRPEGHYEDRNGAKYFWSEDQRQQDLAELLRHSKRYAMRKSQGLSEEHCRGVNTSYSIRQNFVFSANARGHMHLAEIRSTNDVQIETRKCSAMMYPHLLEWMPEVFGYHQEKRLGKNKLAP